MRDYVLLVLVILTILVGAFLLWAEAYSQPCEKYANWPIKEVPTRCLTEL